MKICFFGLGSIGQKHLKNLRTIFNNKKIRCEIHAFRSTKSNKAYDVEREIYNIEDLDSNYDIIFITNPTAMHYATIKKVINKTKNLFIEKPIFDDVNYDLKSLNLKNGIYYVAAPLRHTGLIEKINEIVKKEKVFNVRAICSSYLPDWRPDQDYRKNYSAKSELGGGVSIDLIHEWDYLTYLFGFPEKIYNLQGKFSELEIDSEDLSVYIAKYNDKIIELHLDYFGRIPRRELEIYIEDDVVIGDFIKKEIRFLKRDEKIEFEKSDMYMEEMKYFLEIVLKKKVKENINTVMNAYKVLELIKK